QRSLHQLSIPFEILCRLKMLWRGLLAKFQG
ncbi:Chromosome partition protein Smc, partial [Haemophilus influenzae]